jgi:hypothetical protein
VDIKGEARKGGKESTKKSLFPSMLEKARINKHAGNDVSSGISGWNICVG